MERVNRILKHPDYQRYMELIGKHEADRRFCRHDSGHAMDVARIMTILAYQERKNVDMELLYATALLHDIGRALQYEDGTEHEIAGTKIAPVILREAGYTEQETQRIITAIGGHRKDTKALESVLSDLLYRADKLSRPCYDCKVQAECYWSEEKKNLEIKL